MLHHPELRRRQRKSARVALYGSLVLSLGAAVLLGVLSRRVTDSPEVDFSESQAWADTDWEALPEVRLLQDYVRIDTNAVDGSEVAGARFLAAALEAAGIPAHIEQLDDRHANLWAVLEGDDPRAVVLHSHIDVEPILRPEAWKYPPFSGHIQPPWIYGRGAFDMKSLAAAQLHAFLELERSGKRLARSVILLATGSEERGSDLGTRWFLRAHPELAERFWVVLTEGGVVEAVDRGEGKYWGVEIGQKRFVDVIVCSPDKEPLAELRRVVRELSRDNLETFLPEEVAEVFASYAPTRGREDLRDLLAEPGRLVGERDRFLELPRYLRALLRSEASPFPVYQTEDGTWEVMVKVHLLPGQDFATERPKLLPDWLLFGLDWTVVERPTAVRSTRRDHPAYRSMLELLEERYPEVTAGPYFLPWTATDSRFFRLDGIPSYGFSPFLILTPDTLTGARPNERVALPGYVEGTALYRELLDRLTDPLPRDGSLVRH